MTTTRNTRRTLTGVVTSTKMDKSIGVVVTRTTRHPKYGKIIRQKKKYLAHDGEQAAEEGDTVEIVATRPVSKSIRWRLGKVITRSAVIAPTEAEAEATLAPPVKDGDAEEGQE